MQKSKAKSKLGLASRRRAKFFFSVLLSFFHFGCPGCPTPEKSQEKIAPFVLQRKQSGLPLWGLSGETRPLFLLSCSLAPRSFFWSPFPV